MWLNVPETLPNDDQIHGIRIAGVCSGSGMLETSVQTALQARGIRSACVCHCEWEAVAAAALKSLADAAGHSTPVWDDLTTFDGTAWRGRVDILTAGLPCPAFSLAGKGHGNSDPRAWGSDFHPASISTWGPQPHFLRVVEEIRPGMVYFENVEQWITAGYFFAVGECLARMGYRLEDPVFLPAESVGAPHRRMRVFILAVSDDPGWRLDFQRRIEESRTAPLRTGEELAENPRSDRRRGRDHEDSEGEGRQVQTPGLRSQLADLHRPGCGIRGGGTGEPGTLTDRGMQELPDPPCGRCGIRRQSPECEGQPDRDGEELGHAGGTGLQGSECTGSPHQGEHQPQPYGPTPQPDSQLGHAQDPDRGQEITIEQEDPELRRGGSPAAGTRLSQEPPCIHHFGARFVRRNPTQGFHKGQCPFGRRRLPHFPPGIDDLAGWATVASLDPTRMPAIESGLPVVADGLAPSLSDLLRIGGNGVVPLAAGTAFGTLFDRNFTRSLTAPQAGGTLSPADPPVSEHEACPSTHL